MNVYYQIGISIKKWLILSNKNLKNSSAQKNNLSIFIFLVKYINYYFIFNVKYRILERTLVKYEKSILSG